MERYKARLVAQGCKQKKGVDYKETYTPVIDFTLVRSLMVVFSGILRWKNNLMDVKCAYLYSDLKERTYMEPPRGFTNILEKYVWRLKKTIYGHHQAGRKWENKLHQRI